MHYENLVDLHTHSDHSFDGKQSCMLLCETAVAKGASCIAITDHCEICLLYTSPSPRDRT